MSDSRKRNRESEDGESEGYQRRTPSDLQRMKLERLMANPDKEVVIQPIKELRLPKMREFDFHTQGQIPTS